MKSLGQNPTENELKQMIKSVDDNGDNEIDFEEFLILMSSKKPGNDDPDKELKDAFAVFDADGSGTISRTELKKLMKNLFLHRLIRKKESNKTIKFNIDNYIKDKLCIRITEEREYLQKHIVKKIYVT